MTTFKLIVFAVGISFILVACNNTTNQNANSNTSQTSVTPTPKSEPTPDTLAEAKTIYAEQCSICHKEDGSGGLAMVGKKKVNAASLKSGKAVTNTDEKLINYITNGDDDMPAFKDDLSAEQIKSLVQFIRKEFQGKTSEQK